MKAITFASVLAFITLAWMIKEANAYLYCEVKVGSTKWTCKECLPNAICGVKEECQTKCAKAKTPQQAEDCLTINCAPLQRRSKQIENFKSPGNRANFLQFSLTGCPACAPCKVRTWAGPAFIALRQEVRDDVEARLAKLKQKRPVFSWLRNRDARWVKPVIT